jgi:hypothetical protein
VSKKTFIDDRGYARFKDSGKLVHRWVASKKVGGDLYPGRVVHHREVGLWNYDTHIQNNRSLAPI